MKREKRKIEEVSVCDLKVHFVNSVLYGREGKNVKGNGERIVVRRVKRRVENSRGGGGVRESSRLYALRLYRQQLKLRSHKYM